ncbi:MAG: tRNA lysidine(34) synthetase TilS [Saprospiraceae bacterium]
MDLLHRFNDFSEHRGLLGADERVLAAVSGGVDSVVLAHLLGQRKRPFGIAHCNFCLRGAESDGDESFVRELTEKLDVPFFVQRFDTKKYATENGLSIQMAARELRYQWFETVRAESQFDCIATGHNLNDSVETTLLHFARGTGLTGLGGMPDRNGTVVRPLLFASRSEILAFAQEIGLIWREDSSNADTYYTRNAIRQRLLPEFENLNPAFLANAAETQRRTRAADANLQYLLQQLLEKTGEAGVFRLHKTALAALPSLPDALFDLLQPYGFTGDQARQVADGMHHTGSEWHAPSGYRIVVDRDVLLLTAQTALSESVQILADDLLVRTPDGGRLVLMPSAAPIDSLPTDGMTVFVDAEILRFPLLLRRWKPGDVFQPLGMGGKSQKLQDFFTNNKLSRLEKEQVWVLEDLEKRIVWIVGMRLDERFKVNAESSKLLKLNWIKH